MIKQVVLKFITVGDARDMATNGTLLVWLQSPQASALMLYTVGQKLMHRAPQTFRQSNY